MTRWLRSLTPAGLALLAGGAVVVVLAIGGMLR
jgi:hypothetical protein